VSAPALLKTNEETIDSPYLTNRKTYWHILEDGDFLLAKGNAGLYRFIEYTFPHTSVQMRPYGLDSDGIGPSLTTRRKLSERPTDIL
jgi:hypothetical protein